MTPQEFGAMRRTLHTPSGQIAYVECGEGEAALFIHGVPLNGWHWRGQLEALSDVRRCIAPDLMGLGATEIAPGQSVNFEAQARMLVQFMDGLGLRRVDLVGNDSGGAISQILATDAPDRIRSLTLTNCDTHGNWPPPAFLPILGLAKAGRLGQTFAAFLANPEVARSPQALGAAFEFPERLTPELLGAYLGPLTGSEKRMDEVNDYVAAIDGGPPEGLLERLKAFDRPTLIVWGDADVFFGGHWGQALGRTIPGTRKVETLPGARLFFPEERPEPLNALLREHWLAAAAD